MKQKVNHAISNNEPLLCFGFQLHDFNLSDLSISEEFAKPVYFNDSQFFGKVSFLGANFQREAYFPDAKFQGGASFSRAKFQGEGEAGFSRAKFRGESDFSNSEFYCKTYFSGHFDGKTKFNYVLFEGKEKVIFDIPDLSNVSFMNTDITGIRFSDKARWGEKTAKEDRFKIIDERLLEKKIKEKDGHTTKDFNLGSIKAVYRNLRKLRI